MLQLMGAIVMYFLLSGTEIEFKSLLKALRSDNLLRKSDYICTSLGYNQYSTITDIHNLQFTITHAQGFSIFTSRFLVTELKQSHCDYIF
jgi:hypothetical protein